MKFNFLKIEPVEILDFEKQIGVELVVDMANNGAFAVKFPNCELSNHMYESYGETIDEAIQNYCSAISGYKIKAASFWLDIPTLVHTRKVEIPQTSNLKSNREKAEAFLEKYPKSYSDCTPEFKEAFVIGITAWLNIQGKVEIPKEEPERTPQKTNKITAELFTRNKFKGRFDMSMIYLMAFADGVEAWLNSQDK